MVHPALPRLDRLDDGPALTEFAVIAFVLALVSVLSLASLAAVDAIPPGIMFADPFGPVVYGTLATALVATGSVLRNRGRSAEEKPFLEERVRVLVLTWLLSTLGCYFLVDISAILAPDVLLRSVFASGLALVVPGVWYSRYRGHDIQLALPGRSQGRLVANLLSGAVLVGALTAAAFLAGFENPLLPRFPLFTGSPTVSLLDLVERIVPSLLLSTGYGVLFTGAIQASLREQLGPAPAVAAVTALSGAYLLVPGSRPGMPLPWVVGLPVAMITVSILAALVAATGCRAIGLGSLPPRRSDLGAATIGVVAATPSLLFYALTPGPIGPGVLLGLGGMAAAAVATLGSEWFRSVWVPIAAFGLYSVGMDVLFYVDAVVL